MTHICVNKLTTIGSDNGLSPDRRQAIIWTNAGILLIRTLGTNFSDFLSEIQAFSFKKMHLKMSSGKWRPSCLGLSVLIRLFLSCRWWHSYARFDSLHHPAVTMETSPTNQMSPCWAGPGTGNCFTSLSISTATTDNKSDFMGSSTCMSLGVLLSRCGRQCR